MPDKDPHPKLTVRTPKHSLGLSAPAFVFLIALCIVGVVCVAIFGPEHSDLKGGVCIALFFAIIQLIRLWAATLGFTERDD